MTVNSHSTDSEVTSALEGTRASWRADSVAIGLLVFLVVLLVLPFVIRCTHGDTTPLCSDYVVHLRSARLLLRGEGIEVYFLYHLVIALFAAIPLVDFDTLATAGTTAFFVLLSVVLYGLVRNVLGHRGSPRMSVAAALLAFSLMIVSHVMVFSWRPGELYMGYIGINVYHNPTIVALKPFALLLFVYASAVFSSQSGYHGRRSLAAASALMLATNLAKPSYTICLLPALSLLAACRLVRGGYVDWRLLLGGIVLPSFITLSWQYYFTYVTEPSSIIFAPLAVMKSWGVQSLLPKFLLSALFPLVAVLSFPGLVTSCNALRLSWLSFGFGIAYTYLLAESGPRLPDGNFGWSGEITLFVLFVESTLCILREAQSLPRSAWCSWTIRGRFSLCGLAFGLHVVSGVLWYAVHVGLLCAPIW